MEAKQMETPREDPWGLWKAEWKTWWGDVLGNDMLKKQGLEERTKLRGHLKGTPMKKSPSFKDENIAASINVGVHGSKVESNATNTTQSTFFPEWKAPSFERNSADDLLLKKERERREAIGSGSL
ncbi:hypothetical protein ACTFIV_007078 [Dictyostelium citrinum]